MARSALTAAGIDPLIVDRAMEAPEEAPTKTASVPTGRFDAAAHVAFTAVDQWQRVDTLKLAESARSEPRRDVGAMAPPSQR